MNKKSLTILKKQLEDEILTLEKEIQEIEKNYYWDIDEDLLEENTAKFWIRKGKIELIEDLLK